MRLFKIEMANSLIFYEMSGKKTAAPKSSAMGGNSLAASLLDGRTKEPTLKPTVNRNIAKFIAAGGQSVFNVIKK